MKGFRKKSKTKNTACPTRRLDFHAPTTTRCAEAVIRMIVFAIGLSCLSLPLLAEPYAFPVPFVQKQHIFIYFQDLPGKGEIRIFTMNGETVATLPIAAGQALLQWDTANADGRKVSSGVYVFEVRGGQTDTFGKIVIIR